MIYFIFILLFIVSFVLYSKQYDTPYKVNIIYGQIGSGKSTYATYIARKFLKKGIPVYSNADIYGVRLFNIDDWGKYQFVPGSCVIIEEGNTIWDNRNYKNFDQDTLFQFIFARHDMIHIFVLCQTGLDKKIRQMAHRTYLMSKVFNVFTVVKPVLSKIRPPENDDPNVEFPQTSYKLAPITSWKWIFIPRYIMYFDSFNNYRTRKEMPYTQKEFDKDMLTFKAYVKYSYVINKEKIKKHFKAIRKQKKKLDI